MLLSRLFLIALTLVPALGLGCGLDWSLPKNHWDGIDSDGYADIWTNIGTADLGDGLIIPVHINFNSHREASSPTLGKGWMVALLESHVEPVDERHLAVIMPDGWTFTFIRNGATDTWRGNAGWVGETSNTAFTIAAPCGAKIRFDQGKIQELVTGKNRTLTYKYNGAVAVEIDEGGKAVLKVESDTSTGAPTGFDLAGKKIAFALAPRPRVMTKLKQNLITGFDPTLNRLARGDGKDEFYTFGTEKNLEPNLTITRPGQPDRKLTWNADTRRIETDGEWKYKPTSSLNTEFERMSSMGKNEYWLFDAAAGQEITVGSNGVKIIKKWFVGGLLGGLLRSKMEIFPDKTMLEYKASYNENGVLINERKYKLDSNNKIKKSIWEKSYNNQGKIISVTVTDVCKITYDYYPDKPPLKTIVYNKK